MSDKATIYWIDGETLEIPGVWITDVPLDGNVASFTLLLSGKTIFVPYNSVKEIHVEKEKSNE